MQFIFIFVLFFKALARRTRKSMQVDASLQNQNLRTDLRWVAKRICNYSARKFRQVAKNREFHAYAVDLRSTCVDLRWVAKRWINGVSLHTSLSSTKVNASRRKSIQVGGQTKHKLYERKLKTCVGLRVRLVSWFNSGEHSRFRGEMLMSLPLNTSTKVINNKDN